MQPPLPTNARHPRRGALVFAVYVVVLVAVFASGNAWLDAIAVVALATLLLWPGLRRRGIVAWLVFLGIAGATLALTLAHRGDIALDFMPVMVNAALCHLFARTLMRGREPLIARVIGVVEGPDRVALPGVAAYARGLTRAWALLLGAQATVLTIVILCSVPDGTLARFGIAPPIALAGEGWRWYLHLGSYACVFAFMAIEYAWRRWHLRRIHHLPMTTFATRLATRWPALARSVMHDDPPADA
jgi:uncharacterized membrane protein